MLLMLSFALLSAFAFWRVRGERSAALIAGALFVSLGVAVALPAFVPRPALAAALALVEAVLAFGLLALVVHWRDNCGGHWCRCSLRAMALGIICLGKIGLWTVYTTAVQDLSQWNWYAAAINGGFVAQAAIAGGFGDGVANRIADLWHRLSGRGARALAGRSGA